jgi:ribosomal protein S18 acetylase RimI-like enzyme
MLHAARVRSEQDLADILLLQQANLRGTKTPAEEKEQGFLTVMHSPETLRQMHHLEPSIIVKDNDELAGYALVMPRACSAIVPELVPMFDGLNTINYKNRPLAAYNFYVMGQICVAAAYRGRGVFDMLYRHHRLSLQPTYDAVVTEIATRNTRSLRAHRRVGFEHLHTQRDALDEWAVVIWDWTVHTNL